MDHLLFEEHKELFGLGCEPAGTYMPVGVPWDFQTTEHIDKSHEMSFVLFLPDGTSATAASVRYRNAYLRTRS
ncbi:MAG TPA: hypothetical protein VFG19_02760 [Geobacteraceae bacterium]|nr:hypothetical protein [Geobacteraceae bacterium]